MKAMQLTVAAIVMGMCCAGCGGKPDSASADKPVGTQAVGVAVTKEKPQEASVNNEPIMLENYTLGTKFVDQGYQGEAFRKFDKGTHTIYGCDKASDRFNSLLVDVNPDGIIFAMAKTYPKSSVGEVVNAFAQKYDLHFEPAQDDDTVSSAKRGDILIEIYPHKIATQHHANGEVTDMTVSRVDVSSDSLRKKVRAETEKAATEAEKKAASDFKF